MCLQKDWPPAIMAQSNNTTQWREENFPYALTIFVSRPPCRKLGMHLFPSSVGDEWMKNVRNFSGAYLRAVRALMPQRVHPWAFGRVETISFAAET